MSAFRELIHLRAEEVRTARFKDVWRKANPNNSTVPQNRFPMSVAEVGDYTYGPIHLVYGGGGGHLKIGRFCSIGPNVTFVVGDEHPLDRLSTFPFDVMTLGAGEPEAISRGGGRPRRRCLDRLRGDGARRSQYRPWRSHRRWSGCHA